MHAEISGTVDFLEKNDQECLLRLRQLVGLLPKDKFQMPKKNEWNCKEPVDKVYELVGGDSKKTYDMHELLDCIIDLGSFQEYKALYGKTILTGYAKIDGMPVGIVANQRINATTGRGETKLGGVIYAESADKAARFIMDCNQMKIPLLFLQDVFGFMVGKEAEQSGIIRSGAKMFLGAMSAPSTWRRASASRSRLTFNPAPARVRPASTRTAWPVTYVSGARCGSGSLTTTHSTTPTQLAPSTSNAIPCVRRLTASPQGPACVGPARPGYTCGR